MVKSDLYVDFGSWDSQQLSQAAHGAVYFVDKKNTQKHYILEEYQGRDVNWKGAQALKGII